MFTTYTRTLAAATCTSLIAVSAFTIVVGMCAGLIDSLSGPPPRTVAIIDCAIDHSGRYAISAYWMQTMYGPATPHQLAIHSLDDGIVRATVAWRGIHPRRVVTSPQKDHLFVADVFGDIYRIDVSNACAQPDLVGHHNDIHVVDLKCSMNGKFLASVGATSLYIWNTETKSLHWKRSDLERDSNCAMDQGSHSVVCGLSNGQLAEIDLETGCVVRGIECDIGLVKICLSPNGRKLAAITFNGFIRLYDWPTGTLLWQRQEAPGFTPAGRVAMFSRCNDYLITQARGDVRRLVISSVATGATIRELRGHKKSNY